jgi:hypothetical protein
VEAVVLQALARDPDHRFASATAMRRALVHAGAEPERAPAVAAHAAAEASAPRPPSASPPSASPPPAPTGPPAPGTEPAGSAPTARRRPWRWLAVAALGVAGVLGGLAVVSGQTGATTIDAVSVRSFDPQGDNRTENEELAPSAIDGDPATAWRTERYTDPASIAGKDGVGLALELDRTARLATVDVTTAEGGWAGRIYVASGTDPQDLAGWGDAVASVADAGPGTTRFSLDGAAGDRVLVWFTRLAPSGAVEVSNVTVRGR